MSFMEEIPYKVGFSSIPQIFIKASIHSGTSCRFGGFSCNDNAKIPVLVGLPLGRRAWRRQTKV